MIRTKLIHEDPDKDPGWNKEGSDYLLINDELISRAPTLGKDADEHCNKDKLENSGPWHPTFVLDARKVWFVLLTFFSGNGSWQHVKKHQKNQN